MDCKLDFLKWNNYGQAESGTDGNLLAEYKMVEKYLMDVSISNNYNLYTCAVAEQPFWECLDIASARTLSGSYGNTSIFDTSATDNVLQQAAEQTSQGAALFGRLGEQIDRTSDNYFGARTPCQTETGGKNYGDGVINAFDMAALMWMQFGQAPYDAVSRDFTEVSTVQGRDDTQWRCNRGETKQMWQMELGNNYCAGPDDDSSAQITYSRRLGELAPSESYWLPPVKPGARPSRKHEMRRRMQELDTRLQAAQPGAMDNLGLEIIEWAVVPNQGKWLRIRPSQTLLVAEYFLAGFASELPVFLSNDEPPAYDCDTCVPLYQPADEPAVLFKRLVEYESSGLNEAMRSLVAQQCAEIVPGNDPMTVLTGNVLSIRQQPLTSACPYDLFVWVPANPSYGTYVSKTAQPFSTDADMLSAMGAASSVGSADSGCGDDFGILAGSTAQDGVRGLVLRAPVCEMQLTSPAPPSPVLPPPSPPPPPPPLPPPPSAPPPHVLLDVNDGDPPPASELHVLSNVPQVITLNGNHAVQHGGTVRFMPLSNGGCAGAASSSQAGTLDETLSTTVLLEGGVDGTDSAKYALCLVDEPPSPTRALVDADFAYLPHVLIIVSHQPPSMPPPPSPMPMSPPPPPPSPPPSPPKLPPPPSPSPTPPVPEGCTNPFALNFRSTAIIDDGSCLLGGCTDKRMPEYNPLATSDDGSCTPVLQGCTDALAANYRIVATVNDDSCLYAGCMDASAINYAARAALPAVCEMKVLGCMDPAAENPFEAANVDDGSCIFVGCTNPLSSNHLVKATIDDGSCAPVYSGCTKPEASNYLAAFNHDDGSCHIPGCMDPTASNFKSDATFDDNTCNTQNGRRQLNPRAAMSKEQAVRKLSARRQLDAGCMDPASPLYSADATEHDGSLCWYEQSGCTDSAASNFLPFATVDDPSQCVYPVAGCAIDSATTLNFNPAATVHQRGSCQFIKEGCMDSQSISFVREANRDNGKCFRTVYGCPAASASNYNPAATVTQGCVWKVEGCADNQASNYASDVTDHIANMCKYTKRGCMVKGADNYDETATRDDGSCVVSSPPPSPPPPPYRPPPVVMPPPSPSPLTPIVDAQRAGVDAEGGSGGMVPAIIGAVVAVILVIVVAVVARCMCKRKAQGFGKGAERLPSDGESPGSPSAVSRELTRQLTRQKSQKREMSQRLTAPPRYTSSGQGLLVPGEPRTRAGRSTYEVESTSPRLGSSSPRSPRNVLATTQAGVDASLSPRRPLDRSATPPLAELAEAASAAMSFSPRGDIDRYSPLDEGSGFSKGDISPRDQSPPPSTPRDGPSPPALTPRDDHSPAPSTPRDGPSPPALTPRDDHSPPPSTPRDASPPEMSPRAALTPRDQSPPALTPRDQSPPDLTPRGPSASSPRDVAPVPNRPKPLRPPPSGDMV